MKQRELARQLGLSESAVSKLAKAGMPTHSVEAAAAWRRARVAPYIKSQPSTLPEPQRSYTQPARPTPTNSSDPRIETSAALQAFAAATPDPIDFIEALANNTTILAADDALAVLHALGHALRAALAAGADPRTFDSPLQRLMRAVPVRLREHVTFDVAVWRYLLRDFLQRHAPDPAGAAAMTASEAVAAELHLYAVACGEWVPR